MEDDMQNWSDAEFRKWIRQLNQEEAEVTKREARALESEVQRRAEDEQDEERLLLWEHCLADIEGLRRKGEPVSSAESESMSELDEWSHKSQEKTRHERSRRSQRDIEEGSHRKDSRQSHRRKSRSQTPDKKSRRSTKRRRYERVYESEDSEKEYFRTSNSRHRRHSRPKYRSNFSFIQAIESFDGDFSKWRLFKRTVEALVLTPEDIEHNMKSALVSKLLQGEAKFMWDNTMALTNDLNQGWEVLAKKFEDQQQIDAHLHSLVAKMPRVSNDMDVNSLAEMNRLILQFQTIIDGLGQEFESLARALCGIIANRFWFEEAKKIKKNYATLPKLVPRIEKLYREARILAACAPAWQNRHPYPTSTNTTSGHSNRTTIRVATVSTNMYCQFCRSKEHWTSDCESAVSQEEKRRIMKEKNLCGRCCCRGHQMSECRARIQRCSICDQDHSLSLHGLRIKSGHTNTNFQVNLVKHEEPPKTAAEDADTKVEQVNVVGNREAKRFWMKTYCNGHEMDVLIDTGATISMISRACVPKYARKRVQAIVARGFAVGMVSVIKEAASVDVSSPKGMIRLEAYLSPDMESNTLIIGQDQISLFLQEESKILHTVWGDYDFEAQQWNQPKAPKPICFAVQAWHECQEEEKVDEQEIAMEVNKLDNGRYMASFPFFSKLRPKPNYEKAVRKVTSLQQRLNQEGILEEYGKQISELLKQDHAEEIFENDGHFIGHRAVERPDATSTKFRVVLTPLELNELLWKGEARGMDVLGHLIRLRCYPYVLIADIQKAFLQILIRPEDRKHIRFLWIENGIIHKYQMTVLPFGVVSAPAILTKVLEMVVNEMEEPARSAIQDAVYMDDMITGHSDPEQLAIIIKQATETLAKAGFQLHKVKTNSKATQSEDSQSPCKVLGIHWNPLTDELTIPLPKQNCPATKRELLSFIGRIFDPYGAYDPCKIELRVLYSQALPLEWDEPFGKEFQQEVRIRAEHLSNGKAITLPRLIPSSGTLWCFSDASAKALGYVIFLDQQFVFGRAKVTKKSRSIVDGELQALFELSKALQKILPMIRKKVKVHLLSDSQANLNRLAKSPNDHAPIIARRLLSILKTVARIDASFFHIPGNYNPADCYSRSQELRSASKWLQLDEEKIKKSMSNKVEVKLVCQARCLNKDESIREWLQNKPLSLQLSWIAKMKRWHARHRKLSEVQSPTVMDSLAYVYQRDGDKPPPECKEVQGIYKYNARNVELVRTWIPNGSALAKLLIWDAHRRSNHRGIDMSMALIPWSIRIQNGNRMMRAVIAQCFRCRRTRALGIVQPLGPLHENQLRPCLAFEDVSLDCFGPLKLANGRKIWGLVVYCRSSKAVKLSVVEDMTGETLHQVLLAIWNQVGYPKRVHSDQGTNFMAVRNEILSRPTTDTVNIQWTLSTPYAPWMNGGAEKMVHTAKLGLQQFTVLSKSHMGAQRRFTFVEKVVNARPILHLDGEAISAFEMAHHRKLTLEALPEAMVDSKLLIDKRLRRDHELGLLWKSQYLAKAARYNPGTGIPVKLNDVFLVPDKLKNRLRWCTARVVDLMYGTDGLCRSVKLLFRNADVKREEERECWRPVQGLIPLTSAGAEN